MPLSVNVSLDSIVDQMDHDALLELLDLVSARLKKLRVAPPAPSAPLVEQEAPGKTPVPFWIAKMIPAFFLHTDIQVMIVEGHHIHAIKALRERWSIGLKEAKDIADEYRMLFEKQKLNA